MRYLDKLLESLETSGPRGKGKPNNFKLLTQLVRRGREADKVGDKLDAKYMSKHKRTGKGSTNDKKQNRRLTRLKNTAVETDKSFKQADKLVSKVHLKGGGEGDGKPRGKLRLAHKAYQQIGYILAETLLFEYALTKPDESISVARKNVEDARKQGKMAAKAIQTNPKKRRYQDDLIAANKRLNKNKPKASEPMTHER